MADPDNMGNMTCATYINKRLEEQKAMVNKYAEEGKRMPPAEKQKLMDLTKQSMVSNPSLTNSMFLVALKSNQQWQVIRRSIQKLYASITSKGHETFGILCQLRKYEESSNCQGKNYYHQRGNRWMIRVRTDY